MRYHLTPTKITIIKQVLARMWKNWKKKFFLEAPLFVYCSFNFSYRYNQDVLYFTFIPAFPGTEVQGHNLHALFVWWLHISYRQLCTCGLCPCILCSPYLQFSSMHFIRWGKHFLGCYGMTCLHPKSIFWSINCIFGTILGDRAYMEVIKVKWPHKGGFLLQ